MPQYGDTKNLLRGILSLCIVFVLVACSKNDKEENPGSGPGGSETKKGFHTSKERPVGASFVLPAGVTIGGKIRGYEMFATEYCDNKTDEDAKGIGAMVRVCVPFFNNNNFPVAG